MDITFGYDLAEDRIWLMRGEDHLFWLTRRLSQNFLIRAARYLEQTVGSSGLPHEPPPEQRIRLDHAETLAPEADGATPIQHNKVSASAEQLGAGRLVSQIDLVIQGADWQLVLRTRTAKHSFTISRLALHRLLGALVGVAGNAHWQLEQLPDWLTAPEKRKNGDRPPGQTPGTDPGVRPCP